VEVAVYGLPEVNREQIRTAKLIANPGCYPTCIQLGFLPLIEHGLVELDSLIADAKSGVSGAGRNAGLGTAFCEVSDSFKAYSVSGHRHLPEIRQGLELASKSEIELVFTPHLLPIVRGLFATLYARLNHAGMELSEQEISELFSARYQNEYFVQVLPPGSNPDTRSVRGSNHCLLAVHRPQSGKTVTVLAVEDNLVKGAAGQAIQNMNIMSGFPETAGLEQIAIVP
jgi:N-acetyl-gamma-glutamyl-phosphate reductase